MAFWTAFCSVTVVLTYLALGAIIGNAIVYQTIDDDGPWPARPVKKICLFLGGTILWPFVLLLFFIWLAREMSGNWAS